MRGPCTIAEELMGVLNQVLMKVESNERSISERTSSTVTCFLSFLLQFLSLGSRRKMR